MSSPSPPDSAPQTAGPRRQLTLFDSSCIIVGIIIGAGIYKTAPDVAKAVSCWWGVMLIWLAGGFLSLCGALGYAELASAYPRAGGDYVYLSRAYGRWAGFLFGWMQLVVVRPGDIAVMAFVFATYARTIYDPLAGQETSYTQQVYACVAVAVLTAINIWGVSQGKWTQNLLTVAKALGLVAIVVIALIAPRGAGSIQTVEPFPLSVAMILVLFTFGGWNEMAYVAAEVKNPRRNIVRALVLGTLAVTLLYLLLNGAFLYALGYTGLATSEAVAVDAVATVFPQIGGRLISVLVCISALGAVNGLVFTGARISYAVGADHRAFRLLGRWDRKTDTPALALLVQGMLTIGLIAVLGSFIEAIIYTAAAVYFFYLATSLAVIVLRYKEPDVERPYRVTGYPVPTLIFCAVCIFLFHGAVVYKPQIALVAFGIILLGLPVYLVSRLYDRAHPDQPV